MPEFRRGTAGLEKDYRGGSELASARLLPDDQKEMLARSLLAEFGVTHVRPGGDGELIHGCVLPFSNHTDQDRNPTASLNYKKMVYSCLGKCQAGGSLIWFVGVMRGTSGAEARKWLADQTSFSDEESLSTLLTFFDQVYSKESRAEPPIPYLDVKVLDPWLVIHPYMTEVRGVPEETIMKFKVGYGVLKVGGQESHRIVIPHFWRGKLVGWQSRRLINDGTPKYQSTPDFPKDRSLYNFDQGAVSAVIVESPFSVLSKAHLAPHIEATFGASVTDRQMRYISIHRRVILFMDNDEAGWKATRKLGDYLIRYSEVLVAPNEWSADPADMDDETYLALVEGAIPYALWSPPGEVKEWDMGIRKYGSGDGEILTDDEQEKKTASANWTEKDSAELLAELGEDESADSPD